MLDIQKPVGALPQPNTTKNTFAVTRFVNYAEHPGQYPVPANIVVFNPFTNVAAVGDKHGRVLIINFFHIAVYTRLDVVDDIFQNQNQTVYPPHDRTSQVVKKKIVPRRSPVNGICFTDPTNLAKKEKNGELKQNDVFLKNQYMLVAVASYVVVYSENGAHQQPIIVLDSHRLEVHSLCWLPAFTKAEELSDTTGHVVSGSLDAVIVWNPLHWTQILRLGSTRTMYPKIVCPVWWKSETVNSQQHPSSNHNLVHSPILKTSLLAVALQNNKVLIWDIYKDCQLVAVLKESQWKARLLKQLYPVNPAANYNEDDIQLNIDLMITNHNELSVTRSRSHIPSCQLFISASIQYNNHNTQPNDNKRYQAALLIWEKNEKTSPVLISQLYHIKEKKQKSFSLKNYFKIILLLGRPLHMQCLNYSENRTALNKSVFHNTFSLSHISILFDTGVIEIRDIAELEIPLLCIKPAELSMFSPNQTLFRNMYKMSNAMTQELMNSSFRSIKCFAIDIESRRLVMCLVDGSTQIVFFHQYARFVHSRRLIEQHRKTLLLSEEPKDLSHVSEYNKQPLSQSHSPKKHDRSLSMLPAHSLQHLCVPSDQLNPSITTGNPKDSLNDLFYNTRQQCSRSQSLDQTMDTHPSLYHKNTFVTQRNQDNIDHDMTLPTSGCFNVQNPNMLQYQIKQPVTVEDYLIQYQKNEIALGHIKISIPSVIFWVASFSSVSDKGSTLTSTFKLPPSLTSNTLSLATLRASYLLKSPYRYPDTYREHLWEMILELPKNQEAFNLYLFELEQDGGVHPFYENLEDRIPLRDPVILKRLKKMLGCIAYWCPSMKEISWIPQLVFGIISLYGHRPLFCFELFLSMTLWWSYLGCKLFHSVPIILSDKFTTDTVSKPHLSLVNWGWFTQMIPGHPPLNLLTLSSFTLFQEDSFLWSHIITHWGILNQQDIQLINQQQSIDLVDIHIRLGYRILWPLIRSWLSEILPRYHLSTLWDHILTNPLKPFLIVAASISILKINRLTLLSLPTIHEYFSWMTSSRCIPILPLIQMMYTIDENISKIYLVTLSHKNSLLPINSEITVTLEDIGWPIWNHKKNTTHSNGVYSSTSDHVKNQLSVNRLPSLSSFEKANHKMSGIMYPQLIIGGSGFDLNDDSTQQEFYRLNDHIHKQRHLLISHITSPTLNPKELSSHESNTLQDVTLQRQPPVVPILESLIQLQSEQNNQIKHIHWAGRDCILEKNTFDGYTTTMNEQMKLSEQIHIRQKLLEFYDECLQNIHLLDKHHPLCDSTSLQNKQTSINQNTMSYDLINQKHLTCHMINGVANDIELLQCVNTDTHFNILTQERLAQRRRVIEEEARALLARQKSSSVSSSTRPLMTDIPIIEDKTGLNDDRSVLPIESQNITQQSQLMRSHTLSSSQITDASDSIHTTHDNALSSPMAYKLIAALRRGRRRCARRRLRRRRPRPSIVQLCSTVSPEIDSLSLGGLFDNE